MRFPFNLRAARVCSIATLLLPLGLTPSFAHMGGGRGPVARPGPGFGHSSHFASGGFNRRVEPGRFGFNHLGPNRFDRFGFHHFNRYGGNPLLGWGWGDWGGFPTSGTSKPVIVEEGAPVIINIGLDSGPVDAGGALSGGCVIHKLNYDNAGKYVGERQIPRC
jgi:hypothetical protein